MNRSPEPRHGSPEPPDDLLELYALDLLDADQRAAVEQRLERDPAALERVRELRGVTAMLAFDLEPVDASPGLKERILAAARADLEREGGPPPRSHTPASPIDLAPARTRRGERSRWFARAPWAVAAVLALALAGSMAWNVKLRGDLDERPQTAIYAVRGSDIAAGVSGDVLVINDGGETILTLAGLPALEPGKVYQVWLIADDTPQPNVTFVADRGGLASVGVPGEVRRYQILAITIEPLGGSVAPTTAPIIVSDLTKTTS